MASTLVLSHAYIRSWSSSTLKLDPRFPFVEEAFSTWGGGGGGESETDIEVFWDVSKSCKSISYPHSWYLWYMLGLYVTLCPYVTS